MGTSSGDARDLENPPCNNWPLCCCCSARFSARADTARHCSMGGLQKRGGAKASVCVCESMRCGTRGTYSPDAFGCCRDTCRCRCWRAAARWSPSAWRRRRRWISSSRAASSSSRVCNTHSKQRDNGTLSLSSANDTAVGTKASWQ